MLADFVSWAFAQNSVIGFPSALTSVDGASRSDPKDASQKAADQLKQRLIEALRQKGHKL